MARNPTLPVLAALALTPALAAQGFSLDKIGGGMPGNTSFQVRNGIANNVYLILYAFTEVSTPVPRSASRSTSRTPMPARRWTCPGSSAT